MQVFVQTQNGKIKILSKIIDFALLDQGENHFIQKLNKCSDKQAKVQYWISYQIPSNPKINPIEKALMIQSNYTLKQTFKGDAQSTNTKKNSYLQSNLFSAHQLNGFVQKLQKKPVRSFTIQIGKRDASKSIDKNLKMNRNPSTQKYFLNKIQRRESSSNKNSLQIKNNFNVVKNDLMVQSQFLKSRVDSLTDQLQSKSVFMQSYQNEINNLKIKNRTLQTLNKKLWSQNLSQKSSIERLQEKFRLLKEKYQSSLLNQQNQISRNLSKQKQYQQNMKSCTQKTVTLQYQKQRLKFQYENLKLQWQKNQQKFLSEIQNLKMKFQKSIKEQQKKLKESEQKQKQLQKQKNILLQQYEKNNAFKKQLVQSKEQKQAFHDEILHKNVEIQRLNGKLLLFSQSLQTQKLVTLQLQSLKTQLTEKQNQIQKFQAFILSLKVTINELQTVLEKQKSLNQKILCLVNEKQQKIKNLIQSNGSLNKQLQNSIKINKDLQNSLKQEKQKFDQSYTENSTKQFQLNESISKKDEQIFIKNGQIRSLKQNLFAQKEQISAKKTSIQNLQSEISRLVQVIDEINEIFQRFQQNLLTNQKLTQIISKRNELNLTSLQQRLTKSRQLQQVNHRVKRSISIFQDYLNKLIIIIGQINDKNCILQKQLESLTFLIQKMHTKTLQQSNQLKGSNMTLQEKLQSNQRLILKTKLMIEQKDKKLILLSQKLTNQENKSRNLRESIQSLHIQISQSKQKIQAKKIQTKRLHESIKNSQIIHKQMEQKLEQKINSIETQFQAQKIKQISQLKTKSLQMNDLNKKYQNSLHKQQKLNIQIAQLKQLLATNKIHVQRVSTVFVDIYKQINNIEKQSNLSSFMFIPLRDAVKKVQLLVFPKISITTSNKGQKQKVNNIRTTNNDKNPSHIPQQVRSPQSKLSVTSKGSKEKRERLKSKVSLKP